MGMPAGADCAASRAVNSSTTAASSALRARSAATSEIWAAAAMCSGASGSRSRKALAAWDTWSVGSPAADSSPGTAAATADRNAASESRARERAPAATLARLAGVNRATEVRVGGCRPPGGRRARARPGRRPSPGPAGGRDAAVRSAVRWPEPESNRSQIRVRIQIGSRDDQDPDPARDPAPRGRAVGLSPGSPRSWSSVAVSRHPSSAPAHRHVAAELSDPGLTVGRCLGTHCSSVRGPVVPRPPPIGPCRRRSTSSRIRCRRSPSSWSTWRPPAGRRRPSRSPRSARSRCAAARCSASSPPWSIRAGPFRRRSSC